MSTQTDLWDAQIADIMELTNRPELDDLTALALRMATLKTHLCDHFVRDIVTSDQVAFDDSASVTSLSIATTTEFARFRDVHMVQLLDVDGVALDSPEVEIVEANDIFEPGYRGVKRPYIAWMAGSNLNIYAACGMYGARVLWFQSPNVTRDTYDSWIAQLFPDVIVWEAAMMVWNRTGNETKAKEAWVTLHGDQRNPEMGLINLLKSNYLTTAGR